MKTALLLLCGSALLAQTVEPAGTLGVDDVLDSVRRHYPPLLAAFEERSIADADLLSARGRFDLTLRARVDNDTLGFYDNRRFDAGFEQPLAFQGMSVLGGYSLGAGEFAPYDGKLLTRSLGEVRSGLRLPLFRDRGLDSGRAELEKANIGQRLATLSIDQQKLVILQLAIRRYWEWVAAARRLAVTRDVLNIAEARQKLLVEGVSAGQLPAIEATDNERAILQRNGQVVEARRGFEQASIELSLFLRDARGTPVIPRFEQAPVSFPAPNALAPEQVDADLASAVLRRPDVTRLAAQRDSVRVDAAQARNQALPAVDVVTGFAAQSGDAGPVRRGPQELRASLVFELPWQNRAAKGRLAAAEARIRQIDAREKFARDTVAAEVRDAASAVQAAWERWRIIGDEVRVTRNLEDAERTRFEVGDGTLFMLNLREQATVEAAIRGIAAELDYQRARAAYEFTTAALLE